MNSLYPISKETRIYSLYIYEYKDGSAILKSMTSEGPIALGERYVEWKGGPFTPTPKKSNLGTSPRCLQRIFYRDYTDRHATLHGTAWACAWPGPPLTKKKFRSASPADLNYNKLCCVYMGSPGEDSLAQGTCNISQQLSRLLVVQQ